MGKLHIDKKILKTWSSVADGDGNIDKVNPFSVTISSGKVASGNTYRIRQGTGPDGPLCDCTAVQGKTATFKVSGANALLIQQVDSVQQSLANFYAASAAVQKVVDIEIDHDDFKTLKTNGYSLCFAKKVGSGTDAGSYNVVWQSLDKYLMSTTFSWTPVYALFGTNTFSDNVLVRAQTLPVTIQLGQESVLDSTGFLNPPSTGGPSTSVTMLNQYGPIHPGLSGLSTVNDITQTTPLYVAPQVAVLGTATLTPIDMVLVWFQQNIETSTMFSEVRSNAIEIDLTNSNSETRLYKGGVWTTP